EALRLIERWRPRLVAVDWAAGECDASQICAAARYLPRTGVRVTPASPERAPPALKAACHALLPKPLPIHPVPARLARHARDRPGTGVPVTTASPERAPAALKAGCHALLLKPLTINLGAARLGRLARERPTAAVAARLEEKLGQFGINRTWPEIACPTCGQS